MADVQPLRALHYDPAVVGALQDVVAPPYDVIDASQRAEMLARSPYNIVAIDLPKSHSGQAGESGQTDEGGQSSDPYAAAASLLEAWQLQGALVRDSQPALWAHSQDYTGPDGQLRTRRGFFCRVRIEDYGPGRVRPHERTHPGPKEDRLRLTRATRANVSPIFSLYSDPTRAAWQALAPATEQPPWGEVTDADGTVHRLWRVSDPAAIAAVQAATSEAELLIADGHHRYETMHEYARERDSAQGQAASRASEDGAQSVPDYRYILMCLVALEDPGLTVFPTHRLLSKLDEDHHRALKDALELNFNIAEIPVEQIAPPDQPPGAPFTPLQLGYINHRDRRALRLTLKDQAIADAALEGHSEAYRHLDTGVLEALLLKGALGLSDEDISHLNGLFYARSTEEALQLVNAGTYDAAFFMRPTPVAQVKDVAAAGENMPPKSTFFFPKLLTGLLLNPLT